MVVKTDHRLIISTRQQSQAKYLEESLMSIGIPLVHFPMIQVVASPFSDLETQGIRFPSDFDWMVFSSPAGVSFYFQPYQKTPDRQKLFEPVKMTAIGKATAKRIVDQGFTPVYIEKKENGISYGKNLNRIIPEGDRVLLIKGNLAPDTIEQQLKNGQIIQKIVVYRTLPPVSWDDQILNRIIKNEYGLLFFASPSGFHNFMDLFSKKLEYQSLKIACIGPVTAAAVKHKKIEPRLICRSTEVPKIVEDFHHYFNKN